MTNKNIQYKEQKPKRNKKNVKQIILKNIKQFSTNWDMFLAIFLIIGLIKIIPNSFFAKIFTYNKYIDSIIGAVFGSVLAGNPITSYIIGGELLKSHISLFAVTSFLVAWVTVGVVSLPLEIKILGKKFAIKRNMLSFIFSILIAITTVVILQWI